jgi:hypothetical protein
VVLARAVAMAVCSGSVASSIDLVSCASVLGVLMCVCGVGAYLYELGRPYVARGRGYVEGGSRPSRHVSPARRCPPPMRAYPGGGSVHARLWPPLLRACRLSW